MPKTVQMTPKHGVIQRAGRAAVALSVLCLAAPVLGQINKISTAQGIEFGIVGAKPSIPAPTLFIFASTIDRTLGDVNFNRMGMILRRERGFLLVSMDLPSHGADRRTGEPEELSGWAFRISRGDDPITPFVRKASAVLDFLIATGYSDPEKIAASGTSRGGFIALRFSGAEPRVKWTVAFAPVTDLTALREFAGLENNATARALSVERIPYQLADRAIWVCIGNNDDRVGTDHAIEFTRQIVKKAVARGLAPNVTLRVDPVEGHSIAPDSHENAAKWLMSMQR